MSGARGEAVLQVQDGTEVRVLFTNRALAEVEGTLGRSILAVAQGFGDGTAGILETVQLLRAGMEAARREAGGPGPAVTLEAAFAVLDEAGFAQVVDRVMRSVAEVLSYGSPGMEAADPNP